MPKESFPVKKPGDSLAAAHINDLGRVVTSLSGGNQGSGLQGTSGWITGVAGSIGPFFRNAKIKQETDTDGVFGVWLQYWDEVNEKWKWDESDDLFMDARCFTLDPSTGTQRAPALVYGDLLTARYCSQRGMWLPCQFLHPNSRWAWIDEAIPARSGDTESSQLGKLVKQVRAAGGTTSTWEYAKDYSDADIEVRIFNGFPDEIPADLHIRVGWNDFGQYEVKGVPCSDDEELS